MASDTYGRDEQDDAEAFDEDNQNLDGEGFTDGEMRTFEELPDVYDVTQKAGDSDDDEAAFAEDLDDDEIIALEADESMADIEDDELAGRMPERMGVEDLEEEDLLANDEAEVEPTGDIDTAYAAADEPDPAEAESETLSDDDLEDLGYRE